MKYESKYGTIEIIPTENGFIVRSDIPFNTYEYIFDIDKYGEALKKYKELVEKTEAIIKELEKKKAVYSAKKSALFNKLYELLNKGIKKILLYGPTGTGKTFTASKVCEQLKNEGKIDDYIIVTFSSGMEDIDLLGKYIPKDKELQFEPSRFFKFIKDAQKENKKIAIIFDEFNRAHSRTLNLLIPLLDGRNGKVVVENFISNDVVEIPNEQVIFLFTANFGASYSGTFKLDDAILNRVDIAIFCDYDKDMEDRIIEEELDDDRKIKIAKKVRDFLREAFKKGMINPFSTRDVKTVCKLLSTLEEVTPFKVYIALLPIIHKLTKIDPLGYPDTEFIEEFEKFLKVYLG